MDAASSFIPIDRRHALARGRSLPDRAAGAALLADIAGFTPLTEAFAVALGPQRGAEELTRALDRVYDALIAVIDHYQGSVLNFSGDAFLAWFDDMPMIGSRRARAAGERGAGPRRAATAALALQAVMRAHQALP